VTVGKQEDGTDGLILECVPEATPVKPKPEAEVEGTSEETGAKAKKPRKARKAPGKGGEGKARAMVEADVIASDEAPKTPPRKGSIVPRVPKSK
jgi:ATP-dependent Clp protease ATP-binding subunit ClpA